ncbi:MAG: trehalose 6-phosphate phosphatase [Solirubrobacterales bacterium]|jgi:trehalose-phosphatase|nr:trehalose 6-phosphate phosphatase [Solirubrobacterales bacterium]
MDAAAPILEPLRADPGAGAILCDIDGTLAPIVDDPEAAEVPPAAREALAELAGRYRLVACVSGRRASAARRMVGVEALTYAGNHGLELLAPGDSRPRLDPALGHRASAAAGFVTRLDWDGLARVGLRLEDKGPIQAIHWRGAPDAETAAQRAREIGVLAEEEGLVPHLGRMVLEVRPLATVHKGIAVRRLVQEAGVATALFGGDDRTDLDAFAALRELEGDGELDHAVCVGVASPETPPEIERRADLTVAGPEAFLELLQSL